MARLVAYHPARAADAMRALRQSGGAVCADLARTAWQNGALVRVVPSSGVGVTIGPAAAQFAWDGALATLDFAVHVDARLPAAKASFLKFDFWIDDCCVASVHMALSLAVRRGWLDGFAWRQQYVSQVAFLTAYASYALEDWSHVRERLEALRQHTGIEFFTECLARDPKEERKGALERTMAKQDRFLLFWSKSAQGSEPVTWEWKTALKTLGVSAMEAQRLGADGVAEPTLPPELQELTYPKEPIMRPTTDQRFFFVGCALSVFVAALVVWAFVIGNLTDDQRTILRVALPLASGFVVGSFVGALTVKARGLIPSVVATATGGFGVWLLTAFVLLRTSGAFAVVVQPHEITSPLATMASGRVSLQVGEELRQATIDGKGQAVFLAIPSEFAGAMVPVRVEASGFEMVESNMRVRLHAGKPIEVPMRAPR